MQHGTEWCLEYRTPPAHKNTPNFPKSPLDVIDMLQDMVGDYQVEGFIGERDIFYIHFQGFGILREQVAPDVLARGPCL